MSETRQRIAAALSAADRPVSGEALAKDLGLSRAAVWKHIRALKQAGYDIESRHAHGYRLVSEPDLLGRESISARLTTKWLGHSLVYADVTGSTNTDAAVLGREGARHGTVVVADRQTSGRGRLGRTWESEQGINLYMSALLRPRLTPAEAPQLSLIAGVAVSSALEQRGLAARIKWPNDVVVGKRKVCGVLTEIDAETDRVSFVVVGIGVNINSRESDFPEELRPRATSFLIETGSRLSRAAFLSELLAELERVYEAFEAEGFAAVRSEWEQRSDMAGRKVAIDGAGRRVEGVCRGIGHDGSLLVEDGQGRQERVIAGDVTVLGGYE